jgi:hypothetical protein
VARTHDEVVAAREDWAAGRRFGAVHGYDGDPLPAPPLPTSRLRSRDRHGRTRPGPLPGESRGEAGSPPQGKRADQA